MRKFFLIILFLFLISFYRSIAASQVSAALVTIDNKGQTIWKVLGDSTLEVKAVAKNLTATNSEISLNNTNGKIELNNIDVTNLKGDLVEVVARGTNNDLKIGSLGNQFSIQEQNITAITPFPITINPDKNELLVVTNSGSRLISVLPYEATLSLMRAKIIDKVNPTEINLNENAVGILEYSISGQKNINLFNIATINADVTSLVSASTGEVLKINEPQWLKFFGFLFT